MVKRSRKRRPEPGRARTSGSRPPAPAAGVASRLARLVENTVLAALAGVRDVGSEVGHVAVGAVRGSIRAAGEIGADVGRLALSVAEGALGAADRITAASRAASRWVEPATKPDSSLTHRRDARRDPQSDLWAVELPAEPAAPGDLPPNPDAYARRSASSPPGATRKPLARSPSRVQRATRVKRPRKRAG